MAVVGPFPDAAARKKFFGKVAGVIQDSKMPDPDKIKLIDIDQLPPDFGAMTESEFLQMMSLGLSPTDA